jgi:hypothetical protein
MRAFARPPDIRMLSLEARILYTAFGVFMLVALGTTAWLYADSGFTDGSPGVRAYYLGDDDDAPASGSDDAPAGGPALDLAPEEPAKISAQKNARAVVETFHFHAFSVPVCLLIVGHIFMMTRWTTRTKVAWLAIATAATLVHVLAPVLVRFVSSSFAPVFQPSAILMLVTWLVMLALPIWHMWGPEGGRA